MVRNILKSLVVSSLLLCSHGVIADPGFGLYANLGLSVIKDRDSNSNFQGNSTGGSYGVDYRTKNGLSFGFGGFTLGSADDTLNGVDTNIDVRGLELFLRYPFWQKEHAEVFARIGGVHYFADVEPGGVFTLFGNDGWDLGLGVDFLRDDNWTWRLEARYMNGDRDEAASLFTAGIRYQF